MAEILINGVSRTEFGKGAARRARRDGMVPGVSYGHGAKPAHISLPALELGKALKTANVLLDIVVDGKTELTLPKSIVRDAIKGTLEHIDLVIVRRGERVVVSVPIHTSGEFDRDGILEHMNTSIEVETEATAIPDHLALDLTSLVAGESLYASDVKLPSGMTLVSEAHMPVVHLSVRSSHDDIEAADTAAAAAASAASTEVSEAAEAEKKD